MRRWSGSPTGATDVFGARRLRRTIQRELDNQLSRLLLSGGLNPGDTVAVTVQDGALRFESRQSAEEPAGSATQRAASHAAGSTSGIDEGSNR